MPFQPSFGDLGEPAFTVEAPTPDAPFRIAVLGDFSGRGHRGENAAPDAIAGRKPYKVSRENIDDLVKTLKVKVKIPDLQGEPFEHALTSMEDFHPDQIHEKIDRFAFVSDEDDKAALMAALLHHPHFQAVESAWRGVDWMLRRAQKAGNKVEAVLYDITQQEFAASLNAGESLAGSALYQLLIEQATQGPKGQPWALWVGLYDFDLTGPDAQTLGRIARIARHAAAPFLAGTTARVLDSAFVLEGDASAGWSALRKLPESALLGLALPRFLVRLPYGENTQSIERFTFEEFAQFDGKKGYLWANAALACTALLTQSFLKDGWGFKSGSVLELDAMPMHAYVEDDEEASTLTEAWLTRTMVEKFVKLGLMPFMAVKGRNAIQLSRFLSMAQPPKDQLACELVGRWNQAGMAQLPRSTSRPPMTVGMQFGVGTPPTTAPAAPAAAGPAPAAANAPAPAATPTAAAAPPAPPAEEAMDPELAALMAQFDAPAASPAAAPPPPAAPPAEEAMDPELAALMAQFDAPAAPPAASPPTPAAPPAEEAMDPELAALMAQFDAPAPAAAPEAPPEELDPELAALMKQLEG